MVKITVDDRTIEAEEGSSVLQTCLENEIYIPNLCFLPAMKNPPGGKEVGKTMTKSSEVLPASSVPTLNPEEPTFLT